MENRPILKENTQDKIQKQSAISSIVQYTHHSPPTIITVYKEIIPSSTRDDYPLVYFTPPTLLVFTHSIYLTVSHSLEVLTKLSSPLLHSSSSLEFHGIHQSEVHPRKSVSAYLRSSDLKLFHKLEFTQVHYYSESK